MLEELANIIISESFVHVFNISEDGLYLLKVSARAKNEKQINSTDDEDLLVEIDGRKFSKLDNLQRYADSPAAFSGGRLHNKLKTVFILIYLSKGKHSIKFIPDGKPRLEGFSIKMLGQNLSQVELDLNEQAEDGDRRPWLTFVLVDLPIRQLQTNVKTEKRPRDSDDLRLIINNVVKRNFVNYFRKLWFWLGFSAKDAVKGDVFEIEKKRGLHYVEFWADRMPVLQRIVFVLGDYTKRTPTVYDPEWTGDFDDDSEQMVLARAIYGEARSTPTEAKIAVACSIRNRVNDKRWGKSYHEVILQPKQDSAFNKNDNNHPFVIDPLCSGSQRDKEAWLECFEIAGQIMAGEHDDPTLGANHYYRDFIPAPYWTKDRNAVFKVKIDNILFYCLGRGPRGIILLNMILLPMQIIFLLSLSLPFFVVSEIHNEILWQKALNYEPPIEEEIFVDDKNIKVIEFPAKPKTVAELVKGKEAGKFYIIEDEVAKVIFGKNGEKNLKYFTNNNLYKSHLRVSPDGEKLAFYQDVHSREETFDYDDDEARERYYSNHTTLQMMEIGDNLERADLKEIYRGSYKTSSWHWLDNNRVMVKINVGTGYLQCLDLNIYTG